MLLSGLPGWFGGLRTPEEYIEAARTMENWVARDTRGVVAGVGLVERRYPESVELHLLACAQSRFTIGLAEQMLQVIETELAAEGVRLLAVQMPGESDPDQRYQGERDFYKAAGFLPVLEGRGDGGSRPFQVMVKILGTN